MSKTVSFKTFRYAYIRNVQNNCQYMQRQGTTDMWSQETNWHFIPNQTYRDYMNNKDVYELLDKHHAFRPVHCSTTIQNLIPMSDQLAIQQDTTFLTFNNTIYALCYQDKNQETLNTVYNGWTMYNREGANIDPATGNPIQKQYCPTYTHQIYNIRKNTSAPQGAFWDPLTNASCIQELRPGKNAVKYEWSVSGNDNRIWMDTSMITAFIGVQNNSFRTQFYDVSSGNLGGDFVTFPTKAGDNAFNLKGIQGQTNWKTTTQYATSGLTYEHAIPMIFIKMIPLFDPKNNLMPHEGQICIYNTITFEVKPTMDMTNIPTVPYHYADLGSLYDPVIHLGWNAAPRYNKSNISLQNSVSTHAVSTDQTLAPEEDQEDVQSAEQKKTLAKLKKYEKYFKPSA